MVINDIHDSKEMEVIILSQFNRCETCKFCKNKTALENLTCKIGLNLYLFSEFNNDCPDYEKRFLSKFYKNKPIKQKQIMEEKINRRRRLESSSYYDGISFMSVFDFKRVIEL